MILLYNIIIKYIYNKRYQLKCKKMNDLRLLLQIEPEKKVISLEFKYIIIKISDK
jgi:hypothetical protein